MDLRIDAAIGRLASEQHGIITRHQALKLGLGRGAIESRRRTSRWLDVERGVYLIHGAPLTWHAKLTARCLALDAVASHRSAAALHGLDRFDSGLVEISVPRWRRVPRGGSIIHESTDLHLFEPQMINGVPTTPIGRLAVDLGAVIEFDRYQRAVTEMVRRKMVTWEDLLDQLIRHSRRGRNGVGVLRALLDERFGADVGDSVLEGAFLRELHRRGLPRPVAQLTVRDHAGFVARVDFAYPELRIAIELDGQAWHGESVFDADREKRLRLVASGWTVVEITWRMLLDDPAKVFRRLERLIRTARNCVTQTAS